MRRAGISGLFAAVLVAGCSKEQPPPPPAPIAPKPSVPEPALPPLGTVNFRDWGDIDEEQYLSLPLPPSPPALKWDFAPGHREAYTFSESLTQRMERESEGKRALNTSREKNKGFFEFVAGRDRTALGTAKIQTQEASLNDQVIAPESFAKRPPSVCECIVSEDGQTEVKSAKGLVDARIYVQSLFALQPGTRELKPGTITTRLAGAFKVERYDCVRLESEFEIATQKPSERLLLRGRVVSYFALAERKFIRASASVATSSRTNARSKEGPWITSSLDAVTTYRVKLLQSP